MRSPHLLLTESINNGQGLFFKEAQQKILIGCHLVEMVMTHVSRCTSRSEANDSQWFVDPLTLGINMQQPQQHFLA